MIAGLTPHPSYYDSGIPWLGAVPGHWEVLPIGAIGRLFKGNGGSKEDEAPFGVPCVRYGDLYTSHQSFISRARSFVTPERSAAYTHIRFGDVLFAASGETIEEIGKSAVNLIASDAVCGGDVLVLRPDRKFVPRFLGYAADATPTVHQKASTGRGFTVVHIYASQLKRVVIAVPPLREQAAIVHFLDHADRRIRRYIRAKQKLIKLLEEQKQAIIHRAVTRGLDPRVRLKPSGVAWLEDVPEHWEVRRAKDLFRDVDCRSATGQEVLLSLRMRQGLVPHGEVSTVLVAADQLVGFKKVEPGQIVMNRMRAATGIFGVVNRAGLVSPDYAVLEPIAHLDPVYFLRLFKTPALGAIFRMESKGLGTGSSGFMRLYGDRFGSIKLPVPPPNEQARIVRDIAARTWEADGAQERASRAISLLGEYRTRLIADVVTGKLDVREALVSVPDDVDGPEPFAVGDDLLVDEAPDDEGDLVGVADEDAL